MAVFDITWFQVNMANKAKFSMFYCQFPFSALLISLQPSVYIVNGDLFLGRCGKNDLKMISEILGKSLSGGFSEIKEKQ